MVPLDRLDPLVVLDQLETRVALEIQVLEVLQVQLVMLVYKAQPVLAERLELRETEVRLALGDWLDLQEGQDLPDLKVEPDLLELLYDKF